MLTSACAPPVSETEAWLSRWESAPEAAVAELYEEADPLIRLDRVERLLMAHPERISAICPTLRPGPAQQRCVQHKRRPHLWTPPPQGRSRRDQAPTLSTELASGPSASPSCPEGRDLDACASQEALDAAQRGDAPHAAALCRSIAIDTWRKECLFRAAEQRLRRTDPQRYAAAVSLCSAAGDFAPRCLGHLSSTLVQRPPPLLARSQAWAPIRQDAALIRAYWQPRDPAYGREAEGRLWGSFLRRIQTNSPVLTGDLLDVLPSSAHPYVRSVVALRLAELLCEPPADLASFLSMLDATLAARVPDVPMPRPTPGAGLTSYPDLWEEDAASSSILYLISSRRPISADPESDRVLAAIEAAARVWPQHAVLLEEASQHPSPMVQREATRLRGVLSTQP